MTDKYCIYCMSPMSEDGICPVCGKPDNSYEAQPHHLPPGTVLLDRYLVGAVLGAGGFGITYIGRDLRLELKVAIKEYFPSDRATRNSFSSLEISSFTGEYISDSYERGKQKFLREARTIARMEKQQVIVSVRDFFELNNTAYIVMEYIEGTTLKKLTEQRGGKIPPQELFPVIEPLFAALTELHANGLIHRDISPDNIMLENGNVRLLDFGCATAISDGGDKTKTVAVKQGYAPIEQYLQSGQGSWTDIYALSATIYFCLTGNKPPEAIDRAMNDTIVPPSKLGVDLTPSQERAIMHGLGVNPKERSQTASEMWGEMYKFQGIKPKPVFPFRQKPKKDRKNAAEHAQPAENDGVTEKAPAYVAERLVKETDIVDDRNNEAAAPAEEAEPHPEAEAITDSEPHEEDQITAADAAEENPENDENSADMKDEDSRADETPSENIIPDRHVKNRVRTMVIAACTAVAAIAAAAAVIRLTTAPDVNTAKQTDNVPGDISETTTTTSAEPVSEEEPHTAVITDNMTYQDAQEYFTFYEKDGMVTITFGRNIGKDLVIPRTIGSHLVTRTNEAFTGTEIETVTLPHGFREIGNSSFYSCKELYKAVLPSTLQNIGTFAFANCQSLREINLENTDLSEVGQGAFVECPSLVRVTLPESLETIPFRMFMNCKNLEYINLGSRITSIDNEAFMNTAIYNITLPDTLRSIGDSAFAGTKLTEIYIPDSVGSIKTNAFADTPLETAYVPSGCIVARDAFPAGCNIVYR